MSDDEVEHAMTLLFGLRDEIRLHEPETPLPVFLDEFRDPLVDLVLRRFVRRHRSECSTRLVRREDRLGCDQRLVGATVARVSGLVLGRQELPDPVDELCVEATEILRNGDCDLRDFQNTISPQL